MNTFLPAKVDWESWSGLFLDVARWRPVVEKVCKETAVLPLQFPFQIKAGFPGSCAVFIVNEAVVVKIYPPMAHQDFYREREVYEVLDGRFPYLPHFLGDGRFPDQIEWPYLLLGFCEGEAIRDVFQTVSAPNKVEIGRELGEMLHQLHATPLSNLKHFDLSQADWQRFVKKRKVIALPELAELDQLSSTVLQEIEQFLNDVDLGLKRPLHLINADLTEDHLLLKLVDGSWQISALIDWADAEVGAIEYEWVVLWFGLCQQDEPFFRAILQAYEATIDEVFLHRALAYTLLHRFGAGIIEAVLGDKRPSTFAELQEFLWPLRVI